MKRDRVIALSCAVFLSLSFCMAGCNVYGTSGENMAAEEQTEAVEEAAAKEETQDINQVHLRDNDSLYENEDETSVVTMYLTVSRGNSSEGTNHTWNELNHYSAYDYEKMGVSRYQCAALLQVGDENGPVSGEVGYEDSVPNATVQIRGQTSSRNAQKNYKIELKKNKGTWRGQRTINLNKHQSEGMRFRNKLSYDLLKGIPQLMSLRTQFVHLYVKDLTEGSKAVFRDYGLYTQVEQLNKTGLKNHGLDSNGQLYKINSFEFYRYEDVIKKEDDASYDQVAFEKLLEIKGDSDHTKLVEMLNALNDVSNPIETVLDQYFDRENLTYWMAYQILTGNVDTQNRNTYLYSPQNSDTWYLIPWDNDASFMRTEYSIQKRSDQGSWECGVSNYWGNVLFQRCLQSDVFREELDAAVLDLKSYLNRERISSMISGYRTVTQSYLKKMPDQMYAPLTDAEYETIASAIPDEVEQNYELYKESLEKPMPFYIGKPVIEGNTLKFNWDASYDFDAEDITYTVEVAKDYLFQEVIYRDDQILIPEAETAVPEDGQYFVRVRATNASGKTQDAFDYYVTDDGKNYGMRCFYIAGGQNVLEDTYEE